jgi:hypothetical protein
MINPVALHIKTRKYTHKIVIELLHLSTLNETHVII